MPVFNVAVEETVRRRTVRQVLAPTPIAARRLAEASDPQSSEEIVEAVETVLERSVSHASRAPSRLPERFVKVPPCPDRELGQIFSAFEYGELSIDPATRSVKWRGKSVRVGASGLRVLLPMSLNPGWTIRRDEFLDIWPDHDSLERNVDRIVKTLRKAFQKVDPGFDQIESVYGLGYRWRDDSCALPDGDAPLDLQRDAEGRIILTVDFDRRLVLLGGYILPCSASHIELLMSLARTPGRIMSNNEITRVVRKREGEPVDPDGVARAAIKRIRKNVRKIVHELDIFEHSYGIGTRISRDVSVIRLKS